MKKYIIFDFDGTIANTNDIIIESWQATFRKYLGHELAVRDIEATFGETLRHTISYMIPDAEIEEVVDHYRKYQEEHNKGKVYVFPGVRELMDELRAKGCKIGIATSRTRNSLTKYMNELGIEGCVDEIISVEDVSKHKPNPESVTALLDKFGGTPDEAIMLGDTKFDVGCAQNAGVESVLVGWSHYVDEESMAADGYEPTYRIAEPRELLDLI
ncbi:MAG: HAD family hydrolase [Mogibacterium sp.]|nr:HAD family hydrolase [Mogibacterium sp.]